MIIHPPLEIAPNLEAGMSIGKTWITVSYSERPGSEGRVRYRWSVLGVDDGEDVSGDDMQSGCGDAGDLRKAMSALLDFMLACAESYASSLRMGTSLSDTENGELFGAGLAEWTYVHSEELQEARLRLEEALDG